LAFYRIAVAIFAALAAHNVYLKHGFKFSTEWVQRIMPDPLFMQLFLSLVLILNRPYLLGMATIVLGAVSTFSDKLLRVSHSFYTYWVPVVKRSDRSLSLFIVCEGELSADAGTDAAHDR
jgi:hypothetical protein